MSDKFHSEAAQQAADRILEQFKDPEQLPAKLANIVLEAGGKHSSGYSWGNQLLVAINGFSDAAGFKQWLKYGRQVEKGQRAFPILAPIKRSFNTEDVDPETGAKTQRRVTYISGWKDVKVFGIEQTKEHDEAKWKAYQGRGAESQAKIEATPFFAAATRLGFKVTADGNLINCGAAGMYSHSGTITLAVENLSTAVHEVAHGVDDKLGTLTKRWGQQPDNEIVAELAGAIVLCAMDMDHDADLGGCYEYISGYAKGDTLAAVGKLLNRTLDCVTCILQVIADPSADLPWEACEDTLEDEALAS